MKINDCTLLVNGYDGGEDLWDGFFKLLKIQWPEFDMPIILNTESKSYTYEDMDIKTLSLYKSGQKVPWAKRFIETLKCIETEYVLVFLDDFWLDAPVDNEFFEKVLSWMRENRDVANFSFQRTRSQNIRDGRFERFEKRPKRCEYRLNCQAGLWRREKLISYLRPHESPWEWEKWGSVRSSRYKESFYTLIDGAPKIFSYDLLHGGAVHRGRWCKSVVLELCEKYDISVDFDKRGFEEDWLKTNPKRERKLLRGIKNRINIIRSII